MDLLVSVRLGLGLAAACGFRVFVPMLGLSIAAATGHTHLASGFEWIGSTPALVCFSVATILEIAAYYVPWIDNALDSIATPTAVIAGTLLTASVVTQMSPLMKWSVAIIAGGGAAGIIQMGTVLLRGASTATTGGGTNFVVSTGEWIGSLIATLLAILLPILAAIGVTALVGYVVVRLLNRRPTLPMELDQKSAPKQQLVS